MKVASERLRPAEGTREVTPPLTGHSCGGNLRGDALLVLGTDLVKDPQTLQRAYDDAPRGDRGFSKNLLVRLDRELEARFDIEAFRHVAEWNAEGSNIEVYLESTRAQGVCVHLARVAPSDRQR
jgi:uncharacterized SAM-dependent methyltransferase